MVCLIALTLSLSQLDDCCKVFEELRDECTPTVCPSVGVECIAPACRCHYSQMIPEPYSCISHQRSLASLLRRRHKQLAATTAAIATYKERYIGIVVDISFRLRINYTYDQDIALYILQ